jgi:hypothetical protein
MARLQQGFAAGEMGSGVIFDRVQRGLPVGPFRFAPRADIPPDGDSDLVAHHPAREHCANREATGELHFIGRLPPQRCQATTLKIGLIANLLPRGDGGTS